MLAVQLPDRRFVRAWAPGQETLVTAAQLRLPVIVGAAGIVTGLLVDEDMIMIARAGVGGSASPVPAGNALSPMEGA
jgi:hypothetical protein